MAYVGTVFNDFVLRFTKVNLLVTFNAFDFLLVYFRLFFNPEVTAEN